MNREYKKLNAIIRETHRKLNCGEISPQDALRIVRQSKRELEDLEAQEAEQELLSFFNSEIKQQPNAGLSS